jgi:TonB-dependent starch-binding outer membrane protein SusC
MKQVKFKLPLRALTLASGLLLTASSFAQTNAIKGHVKDASGEPIMGATITVNGKAIGITDMDGNFSDSAPHPDGRDTSPSPHQHAHGTYGPIPSR